jgi:hypothetical protein
MLQFIDLHRREQQLMNFYGYVWEEENLQKLNQLEKASKEQIICRD